MRFSFVFFLGALCFYQVKSELELIQDEELVNLIRSEKYVVALFTKKFCEECENYENELTGLREDLVETLNAWVVRLIDSSMTRLYTPNKVWSSICLIYPFNTKIFISGTCNCILQTWYSTSLRWPFK